MIPEVKLTIYDPNKELSTQLQVASRSGVFCEIFNRGQIKFKPLKVNEILLDISVNVHSGVTSSAKEGSYVYEKLKFNIKSKDSDEIDLREISDKDIDQKIKEIFERSRN